VEERFEQTIDHWVAADRGSIDAHAAVETLHRRMAASHTVTQDDSRAGSRPPERRFRGPGGVRGLFTANWTSRGLVAAALVVLVLFAYRSDIISKHRPPADESGARYVTAVGQTATVTLTDGSHVTLAPRTTLRILPGFGESSRTIWLRGEASFDVVGRSTHPFVVQTGSATVRVLGTRFTIRRYDTDAVAHVFVMDGKVAISGSDDSRKDVTLTAGMMGDIRDSVTLVTPVDAAKEYMQWIDGKIVFHHVQTTDVLAALTRWYGFEFRCADTTLASRHLTAWMSTESSAAALSTLKQVLDVDLTFDANVVTLHPRRQPRDDGMRQGPRQERLSSPHTEVGR